MIEEGYRGVAVKKDLWINLLKFDINYLTVSHPLDFYYIVNVDKTVGEVTLNNF